MGREERGRFSFEIKIYSLGSLNTQTQAHTHTHLRNIYRGENEGSWKIEELS